MIRLLVVDDHELVRAGLEQLLGTTEDIQIVGLAADGDEALALSRRERPDVILMDISMPGVDGIEATRRIIAEASCDKIVMLTSFIDRDRILDAVDAGASGYLLKDAEPAELVRGIRAAARGDAPLDPRAASALLARRSPQAVDDLTPREREVLTLVADGLPNKLIARRLGIAEKTVKAHLTSAFARIGATDRTQAALWAQRHGLTDGASTT